MNINKWHIIDHDLMLTVYRTDVCSLCGTWYTCLCSSVFHVVMSCSGICIILHPEAQDMAVFGARAQKDRKVGNPCNLSSTPTSNKHTFSGEWGLFLQTRVISRTQMVHSSWVLGGRCFSNQVTLANLKELQVDRWHEWWQCPSGCWTGSKSIQ